MTPDRDRVEEIRLWMSGQTFSEPYPRWADAIVTLLQTIDELRKAGDFVTRSESILACRLLDEAASQFHEHGCNDMDSEYFEDLTEEDMHELEVGYNAWKNGETGETCGDPEGDYTPIRNIGDDMWMAYLAAVIGRKEQGREYQKLKEAVATIPAAVMLAGGPPYRLTFTEECLREILEAQR